MTMPSIAMTISMRLRQYRPTLSSFLTPWSIEVVREAVGLLLELGVGQLLVAADEGDTVRHGVDSVLGKIGNVQGHRT